MATIPPPFRGVRLFGKTALVVCTLAALTLMGYGLSELWSADHLSGLGILAAGFVALALGVLLYAQLTMTHKLVNTAHRSYGMQLDLSELLRRQTEYTHTIAENSSLSDWAKRIVYREKDYEYLRDTIQSAIVRQDWQNAERFIQDLSEELGLRDEASRLREEVEHARQATKEEKVEAALRRFDKLCSQQKWEQAESDSARLKTLFPDEPRIAALPRELELRRQQHKRRLLKEYDEAVRTQNVDVAHRLLFELDQYLSDNEVAVLKESARGVFKAKLFQLGVQFSLAVTDKAFSKAVSIGDRIIREFPNSRYAQEIATMMPALRARAAGGAQDQDVA
jgi:flagellar biosynthesis chaperone FliJ